MIVWTLYALLELAVWNAKSFTLWYVYWYVIKVHVSLIVQKCYLCKYLFHKVLNEYFLLMYGLLQRDPDNWGSVLFIYAFHLIFVISSVRYKPKNCLFRLKGFNSKYARTWTTGWIFPPNSFERILICLTFSIYPLLKPLIWNSAEQYTSLCVLSVYMIF